VGCIVDADNEVDEGHEDNNTADAQTRLTVLATVPDVVGMMESQAASAITSAGLTVGTKWYGKSDTVPAGYVMGQHPAAGATVTPGSAVELTISTGPSQVTVPQRGRQDSGRGSVGDHLCRACRRDRYPGLQQHRAPGQRD